MFFRVIHEHILTPTIKPIKPSYRSVVIIVLGFIE